jgi:hypothetical protein
MGLTHAIKPGSTFKIGDSITLNFRRKANSSALVVDISAPPHVKIEKITPQENQHIDAPCE